MSGYVGSTILYSTYPYAAQQYLQYSRHVRLRTGLLYVPHRMTQTRIPTVATYGDAIGCHGMWDAVHRYAVVPATDGGMSSTAPTRDAVVGGL